jgi:hypothetical protein
MYRRIETCGFSAWKHLLFLRVLVRCLILFALLSATGLSTAQVVEQPSRRGSRVIDDTTKQIYGPNTSRYYYERDVFFNRQAFHSIDTLIRNFHRNASYVQRYNNLYQDLGNIGSAIRPLYYQPPANIGVTGGFHSYDLYWDAEQIRYFDTKSPYTNMNLILGGKGRSLTRATFSRNINPRWNFGFTFRGLFVDKQIQRRGKADRFVRSNYYDAYTAYENKDSTYRLFLNFQRMYHRANEFGGVKIDESEFNELGLKAYFDENVLPWLSTAQSDDLRMNVHLFHQYKIGSALQLYHIADRFRQKNKFQDVPNEAQTPFYDYVELADDSVRDASTFKTFRNEVGIKGNLAKLFYNGYYAIRHFEHSNNHLLPDTVYTKIDDGDTTRFDVHGNESYFGGRISLKLDSLVEVNGWAELIIPNGNYRIEGSIRSKWFEASLRQMQYAPGFLTQAYRGSHDLWINDFGDVESTQLRGFLHYKNSVINFSPGITLTRLRNYIFFDQVSEEDSTQQVLPRQSQGNQILTAPEIRFALTFFRHVTFSTQSIYTLFIENADNAIRVPELMVNTQLSYDNIFFNGNLDMHAGVDLHWKSAYYAHGYDPVIQQFYTQDRFEAAAFPLVDLFFSAKIKRARIFFKYNNLVQAITKSGYFPTPLYPGQRNILDFGFDWSFYD